MLEPNISREPPSSYFPTMEDKYDEEVATVNSHFDVIDPIEVLKATSFEFQVALLRLIQQLFLYRKERGLRTAAYHKDCLLVTKTSTVIDVYLDLGRHQDDPKSGSKVFQAEYIDGSWQVAYCQKGLWIQELARVVKSYQLQCFGTIDDRRYFPLVHR